MGFLRDLGKIGGEIGGAIIALPIYATGKILDSDFIVDVAEATYSVTAHTGDLLGNVAEGTGKCIGGIINQDGNAVGKGLSQVVDAGVNTIADMGNGVLHVAEKSLETAAAIIDGDTETAIKTGKEVAKVALVGAFAFGVNDLIDGIPNAENETYALMENENTHYVNPHWRTLPNGEEIWVDGDGNTSINRDYGWSQTNPDYRVKR